MAYARPISLLVVLMMQLSILAQTGAVPDPLPQLQQRIRPDVQAIQRRVDLLPTLPADSLEVDVSDFKVLHDASRAHWRLLTQARGKSAAAAQAVEARSAVHAMDLWKAAMRRGARLRAIAQQEEAAYYQRFQESLGPSAKQLAAWQATAEAQAFTAERQKIEAEFKAEQAQVTARARQGDTDRDRELDRLQQQILDDFRVTADALHKAEEALRAKRASAGPPAGQPPEPASPGPSLPPALPPSAPSLSESDWAPHHLSFRIDYSKKPPKVVAIDEVFELTVTCGNGVPPFDLTVRRPDGMSTSHLLTEPGSVTIPFSFGTGYPNGCEIVFELTDAKSARAVRRYHIIVLNRRATPEAAPSAPSPPPPPAGTPPPRPPAPAPLLAPLSGTYRGLLWVSGSFGSPAGVGSDHSRSHACPVQLTFEPGGRVTGRCDFQAPETMFSFDHRRRYPVHGWRGTFTIRGTVDWQTGLLDLAIDQGRSVESYESPSGSGTLPIRFETVFEYTAALQGRHTSDPFWNTFLDPLTPAQVASAGLDPADRELRGMPNLMLNPVGKLRHADYGWVGAASLESTRQVSEFNVLKHSNTLVAAGRETTKDNTADTASAHRGFTGKRSKNWYLKILGPDTTPADLAAAELRATSLWPERETTAAVGEHVFATFVGVFSDHPTAIRDLTDLADWQLSPGLEQIRPGVFRANAPGKYEVRARAKGKDGVWMEGYLTIHVPG